MKGTLHAIISTLFLTFAVAVAPLALSDEIENEVEEENRLETAVEDENGLETEVEEENEFENEFEEEDGLGNEVEEEEESETEHELESFTHNDDLGVGSFDVMDEFESEEGSFLELSALDDSDDIDSDSEGFDSDDSDGDLDDSDSEDDTDIEPID